MHKINSYFAGLTKHTDSTNPGRLIFNRSTGKDRDSHFYCKLFLTQPDYFD